MAAIPAATAFPAGIPVSGSGAEPIVDPVTGTAFVASGQPADNLAVIDMAVGTLTKTIPAGAVFGAEAVDPATGLVYTANRFADSVSVIDPAAGTVTATITGLPGEPLAIAADPVTDRVYVGLYERGTPAEIAVIDGSTNTLAGTITMPAGTPGGTGAGGIAVDPATGTVYLSFCGGPCHADIIDEATDTVTGQLAGALSAPPDLAVNPDTGTVYVAGGFSVTAFNGVTGAKIATAQLGTQANPLAVDEPAGTLYVPEPLTGAIAVLDAASLAVDTVMPFRTGYSLAIDPATGTLAIQAGGILDLLTPQAPAITSAADAKVTAGRAGTFTFSATGAPPPDYTSTGKLPAGLSLTTSGQITGTPGRRTGGIYPLTITASNGVAPAATQSFILTILQAPLITSSARAWLKPGVRHTFTIRVSAYPAATITKTGKLPPGLRFTTRRGGTAIITGTPAKAARGKTYRIHITARNGVGHAATQTITIHVTR